MAQQPSLSHPGDRTRVIALAPNAFKGTLTAAEAAAAMSRGTRALWPAAQLVAVPIADGGDGSVDAFVASGFTRVPVTTTGPTGERVESSIAIRDGAAVVELADSCGLARLPGGRPAPMTSSTRGLGDAIVAALDRSPGQIVVCLGGSASTDGGAGMITALGARLLDAHGTGVDPSGSSLSQIVTLDLTSLDPRLADVELVVAADVTSPLLGPDGAAAVFAPQKGATPDDVAALEAGLTSWAHLLAATTGHDVAPLPGAGAAGGTGAALLALGAQVRPGFTEIANLVGLPALLDQADIVVTGEGRLDEQSTLGKGTLGVAALARDRGVPAVAVCGSITLTPETLSANGIVASSDLASVARVGEDPQRDAAALVERATARVLDGLLSA